MPTSLSVFTDSRDREAEKTRNPKQGITTSVPIKPRYKTSQERELSYPVIRTDFPHLEIKDFSHSLVIDKCSAAIEHGMLSPI
jgi:hypothetical protein